MIEYIQRDLFRTDQEVILMYEEETRKSLLKVNRRLSAEVGSLKRKVLDLEERQNIMEKHICKGFDNE